MAVPWRERSERLWPPAREVLQGLLADNDLVVIEGAGSPAEINLQGSDYVNLRTAQVARAACLLVTDIDRGGAFAHLYGTHALMPPEVRALVRGFVLNRFRGDAALLAPGPQQLLSLTGVPTVAVLPMWREHGLPEEDGLYDEEGGGEGFHVAVVAYPRISNLDEFQPLRRLPGVRLTWARTPVQLERADWIVLPGSKHTSGDLAWLRAQGLENPIRRHAELGRPLLGVCGGLQMLGCVLHDPHGVDGGGPGLGLLPLETTFELRKLLRPGRVRFEALAAPWAALSGLACEGYEIHHGRTREVDECAIAMRNARGEAIGWQRANVLGLYAHGLFESPTVLQMLFNQEVPSLDMVFDRLSDFIDRHFDPDVLSGLLS